MPITTDGSLPAHATIDGTSLPAPPSPLRPDWANVMSGPKRPLPRTGAAAMRQEPTFESRLLADIQSSTRARRDRRRVAGSARIRSSGSSVNSPTTGCISSPDPTRRRTSLALASGRYDGRLASRPASRSDSRWLVEKTWPPDFRSRLRRS